MEEIGCHFKFEKNVVIILKCSKNNDILNVIENSIKKQSL